MRAVVAVTVMHVLLFVFNPVAPYGYLLSDMYLFMADITNPDFLV